MVNNQKAPASQLDTVLQAIGKVQEAIEERLVQVENGIAQMPTTAQITAIVQEQVKAIVREEVKAIVQEEVKAIVQEEVQSIIQEQVTAIVQQQLANVQLSGSPNPSYADVARTPPGSQPSNLQTLSMNTTPSSMTDTLYCTVDTSNVEETERNKAKPGTIRQEIEKEMRKGEDADNWRCAAVTKDPRNTTRIRITCRNEGGACTCQASGTKDRSTGRPDTPRSAVSHQGGQR
jgi:hypothetical protein